MKEGLLKNGVYQDPNGALWVIGTIISNIMKDNRKSTTNPRLAQYMMKKGYLMHSSTNFRIGKKQVRAWGFNPNLKKND